jgi:tetratricopeptide (TPR) repeat protein
VNDDQKSAAKTKLEEGNALYLATDYKGALAKYKEALASWNHPAIRFNLVRCLVQLNEMVEADQNLQQALEHDKAPFTDEVWQEVLGFQKLLGNMVGTIEVGCKQDGAKLTFDGEPFIEKCPGNSTKRVKIGQHSVVATKEGFLTKEMPIVVVGGPTQQVDVTLTPLDKAAKVVHRFPTWIPWVVFGGGLAVTGVGVLLKVDAGNQMNAYDQDVAGSCAVNGCDLTPVRTDYPEGMAGDTSFAAAETLANRLNDKRESAESRDKLAIGVIAVGAAGAAVGGVLLFLNRGRTVYEDPAKAGAQVRVMPTTDGGMVSLSGRF